MGRAAERCREREMKMTEGATVTEPTRVLHKSPLSQRKLGAVVMGGEVREGRVHRTLTSSTYPPSPGGCSHWILLGVEWRNAQASKVTKSSQEGISPWDWHGISCPVSLSFNASSPLCYLCDLLINSSDKLDQYWYKLLIKNCHEINLTVKMSWYNNTSR